MNFYLVGSPIHGVIPCLYSNTLKIGIHSFPACRSALKRIVGR